MKYIDLTHTFTQNMSVYPGDPAPNLKQIAFLEQNGFNDHEIKTGMHVGTHMDAPFHMLTDGKRLSGIKPERFFGPGHLIDARNRTVIDIDLLTGKKISKGDIVLILTGFSEKFGTADYYELYPEISPAFASKMAEIGIHALGMDTPGPDRPPFAVHKKLLENDVLIIENLTSLKELIGQKAFEVIALPAKFDTDGAPARVVARIQ